MTTAAQPVDEEADIERDCEKNREDAREFWADLRESHVDECEAYETARGDADEA